MARTASTMPELGMPAPPFDLPDTVSGRHARLSDFTGRPLLVMFLCNHCPFVKHVRAEVARLARDYASRGVGVVAISSNDAAAYHDDSPEKMKAEAIEAGYTFPYLYDERQAVAKAYRASCTPDFFLFDSGHRLAYRGQLDDTRPAGKGGAGGEPTGRDLRAALDALLAGTAPAREQFPSIGCNIKWKPGNEPEYARGA